MSDDDTTDRPPGPDLTKHDAVPAPEPAAPASIWEPLDGSRPPVAQPQFDAAQQTWARPHQQGAAPGQPVPPQRVVAAYTAASSLGVSPSGVFTLASWGRRLGSFIIDSLLFGTVALILTVPVGMAAGLTVEETIKFFGMVSGPPDTSNTVPLYAALVVQRLIVGIIPAFFLVAWKGQTPGKRATGLRVMRADGGDMTLPVALKRELLGRTIIFDGLSLVTLGLASLLNYLWPLWDPQRRAGHDFIAGTRVVKLPPGE